MEIPAIYKNSSKEIQNIMINLGANVYSYLNLHTIEEEEVIMKFTSSDNKNLKHFYEMQLNELKEELSKVNIYHKNNMENEKSLTNKQISILQNEIMTCENTFRNKFREEYETKYKESIEHLEEIHNLKMKNKDEIIKSKQAEIEKQNEKIDPILNKFIEKKEFINTTAQGDYGEGFIDEIVNKGLPFDTDAFIDDTHTEGGSGDRIIRFKNGLVLMIEVKNENTIDRGDREQFQNHSKNDFKENKCDCSLFLSLRSQQIPKIGKTFHPIYDQNMVYYGLDDSLSLVEKKHRILSCIEEVYEKFKKKSKLETEDNSHKNAFIYNQHLETLNNQKNDYERLIKEEEKNMNSFKKKLIEVNKKINQVYREIQNKNIKIDEKLIDDKMYVADFIQRIKSWKEDKNIILKNTFRQKIIDEMKLSELDKTMIKKIKLTDIN